MEYQCSKHGLQLNPCIEKIGNDETRMRCRKCRSDRTLRARQSRKAELVAALGGKCQRCGYDRCVWSLDFHHRDKNTKEFGIGKMTGVLSKARLLVEAKKCDLLCKNCHFEIEHGEYFFNG